jgi:hypothetical protein
MAFVGLTQGLFFLRPWSYVEIGFLKRINHFFPCAIHHTSVQLPRNLFTESFRRKTPSVAYIVVQCMDAQFRGHNILTTPLGARAHATHTKSIPVSRTTLALFLPFISMRNIRIFLAEQSLVPKSSRLRPFIGRCEVHCRYFFASTPARHDRLLMRTSLFNILPIPLLYLDLNIPGISSMLLLRFREIFRPPKFNLAIFFSQENIAAC